MKRYNYRGVNHVHINVTDLKRAIGFYTGILGFKVAGCREPDKAWLNFGQHPDGETLWYHDLGVGFESHAARANLHEEHDGGGVEEGAGRGDGGLEVESPVAVDPGDNPAARLDGEADLIGAFAHDLGRSTFSPA